MLLLQLLKSHHESRVVLHVTFQVRGDSLYPLPVATLMQEYRRRGACNTGGEKRRGVNVGGLAPETKSSTRGPTTKNPSPSGANDGSASNTMGPRRG